MGTVNLVQADEIDWSAYEAETEDRAKVKKADSWVMQVADLFDGRGPEHEGARLPWAKVEHDVRLRAGELTVWAGVNGNMKSFLLGQIVTCLMAQGQKCLIASFEMKPPKTLQRMIRQSAKGPNPTVEYQVAWQEWASEYLWLYDQQGSVTPERVFAVCRYAAQELGIKHFVIDSMMKVVSHEDDYNGQKNFLDQLTTIARDYGMHVHMVHHMRKQASEREAGGKADIKGSGAITDQADNVITVWLNKPKKEAMDTGGEFDPDEADMVLGVVKQRNGEWEGKIALWLERRSLQFVATPNGRAMDIAPDFEMARAA